MGTQETPPTRLKRQIKFPIPKLNEQINKTNKLPTPINRKGAEHTSINKNPEEKGPMPEPICQES
ncbi:hypothetical protein C922_05733 [Plasmodium inui San Antonio 1]|uniref:Uncharacterized protein n=1 Tax=Plasmodium inui San Antonio 1 TaxID=1237626 RepID=W7A476_9APIC|nr:hypothetical protein C922_05733 [Plasmodium inui San Antonio 1]EUD63889.1 hypothetical protein C922_05733 [Plasmodium inui San Antonio 1]